MSKCAAFFDIDGTIYREGLITEVFKKIIKYDLVDENKWYVVDAKIHLSKGENVLKVVLANEPYTEYL